MHHSGSISNPLPCQSCRHVTVTVSPGGARSMFLFCFGLRDMAPFPVTPMESVFHPLSAARSHVRTVQSLEQATVMTFVLRRLVDVVVLCPVKWYRIGKLHTCGLSSPGVLCCAVAH
eukprot:scpid89083/ scgid24010/ 